MTDVPVIRLEGDLDIARSHELRERLLAAVRNEDFGLVVDLSDARYIDSVGVSLLFEVAERLTSRQLRMAVVVPGDGLVERVLGIVDIAAVSSVHRDVDGAVAAIRAANG